jgi:dienelactone hydrolase
VTFSDPNRVTPARGSSPAHAGRNLVTTILYPIDSPPATGQSADATPSSGGPYPLVVFAHGFAVTPATYAVILDGWVAAGYVVAAPEFPLSGADGPGPASEADLVEQPADLSAVIGFVTAAATDPASWLDGLVDPTRLAEAGQSDGGSTVAAATLDSVARDPRVTAAVTLSGAELDMPGGSYGNRANVPLLVVQGDRDPVNPPSSSAAIYRDAHEPKGYLDIIGGGHLSPYLDDTPQARLVRSCILGFLDYELGGHIDGLVRLRRDGNWPALTALQQTLA